MELGWSFLRRLAFYPRLFPTVREVSNDHYRFKLDWLARLRNDLAQRVTEGDRFVIGGDWNIVSSSADVWDVDVFDENSTHVSVPEREAMAAITDVGLRDTFRERYGDADDLFSWWDYRGGNFHKRKGMRIDYLLATPPLADAAVSDLIDRNARKGTKPSDHAPVLAYYDVAIGPPSCLRTALGSRQNSELCRYRAPGNAEAAEFGRRVEAGERVDHRSEGNDGRG